MHSLRFPASFRRRLAGTLPLLVFALSAAFGRPAQAADLACAQLPSVLDGYLQLHYSQRLLAEDLLTQASERLADALDPSRTLLLRADVERLRKELPASFDAMTQGKCPVLDALPALVLARSRENEAFVRKLLGPKYRLDHDASITADSEKRKFPATAKARRGLLTNLVHFQIANYLQGGVEPAEARRLLIHRYELATRRASELRATDVYARFAESFATTLDPHSSFFSWEDLKDFEIQMKLSLEGIGATLFSEDGFTIVESIIPGGGADRSGRLRPQDRIVSVRQEAGQPVPVIDMDLKDVVRMIRGKKGTKVTLTVLRKDGARNETFDVTIVRDRIDVRDQAASIRYETRKQGERTLTVGVIDLPSFYGGFGGGSRDSYEDVRRLLLEARARKVDGIVLDLSKNGGGLLDSAVRIAGLFLNRGAVVATRDADGSVRVLADEDGETVYAGPLVILVSRLSASASEILAGTLQAYRRAVIVGDRTFGKGSIQTIVDLPEEAGAIKVTMGMFFLADGKSTQQDGVGVDIPFPSPFSDPSLGERAIENSLPSQRIAPFLSREANSLKPAERWIPVEAQTIRRLAEQSKARRAASEAFASIRRKHAERIAQGAVVRIADVLQQSADPTEAAAPKGQEEPEDPVRPLVDESVSVAADLARFEPPSPGLRAPSAAAGAR